MDSNKVTWARHPLSSRMYALPAATCRGLSTSWCILQGIVVDQECLRKKSHYEYPMIRFHSEPFLPILGAVVEAGVGFSGIEVDAAESDAGFDTAGAGCEPSAFSAACGPAKRASVGISSSALPCTWNIRWVPPLINPSSPIFFSYLHHSLLFWEFMLSQKRDFAIIKNQGILTKINASLKIGVCMSECVKGFPFSDLTRCLWSISNPSKSSEPFPSTTINEQPKKKSLLSFICALCTRPIMLAVPTPLATPANRVSTKRIKSHRSAVSGLTIFKPWG